MHQGYITLNDISVRHLLMSKWGVPGVPNFISMGGPDHSYGRKKVANTGNEGGETAKRPSQPTQAATDSTKQAENAIKPGRRLEPSWSSLNQLHKDVALVGDDARLSIFCAVHK